MVVILISLFQTLDLPKLLSITPVVFLYSICLCLYRQLYVYIDRCRSTEKISSIVKFWASFMFVMVSCIFWPCVTWMVDFGLSSMHSALNSHPHWEMNPTNFFVGCVYVCLLMRLFVHAVPVKILCAGGPQVWKYLWRTQTFEISILHRYSFLPGKLRPSLLLSSPPNLRPHNQTHQSFDCNGRSPFCETKC